MEAKIDARIAEVEAQINVTDVELFSQLSFEGRAGYFMRGNSLGRCLTTLGSC
ncbi:MAG: hypothetical protein HC825_01055 [Oscillatoriales cyanobacterium RM1_1_9]|nr:hypothetical protein [Oscillatoriales cyanobacterium SM2_3_0]NJO45654.1 hypothetical protein [Oscillatoriales cyanobacterium RM2_1_1]NJO70674.1 hypothetical protein [Oscillatoriales cyanobacterium RM1_1_9]